MKVFLLCFCGKVYGDGVVVGDVDCVDATCALDFLTDD